MKTSQWMRVLFCLPPLVFGTGVWGQAISRATMIAQTKPAVVYITVTVQAEWMGVEKKGRATGTGFLIDPAGYVVTNAHIIPQSIAYTFEGRKIERPAKVTSLNVILNSGTANEQTYPAGVVQSDVANDIALLQLRGHGGNLPYLQLGDSDALVETMPVIALGYPFGEQLGPEITVTAGAVTSLRRGRRNLLEKIQLDASVNPGNSGGPLVDERGVVVGVIQAIVAGAQEINFAIPINLVKGLLQQWQIPFHEAPPPQEQPPAPAATPVSHQTVAGVSAAEGAKIAVADFQCRIPDQADLGWSVAENLRTALSRERVFTVVERAQLEKVLEELQLQATGVVDSETALKVGKALGATMVVIGSVTKIGNTYTLNTRFVNVETGTVEHADALTCRSLDDLPQAIEDLVAQITGRKRPEPPAAVAVSHPAGERPEAHKPTPSEQPPRPAPREEPRPTPLLEAARTWPVVFEDSFAADYLGEFADEEAERGYKNGEYVLTVKRKDLTFFAPYKGLELGDFELTVTTRQISGPDDNYYGVMFRLQDANNFYLFNISGDGYYQVLKRKNGEFSSVKRWTPSKAINQGNATNTLRLICLGPQFALFVNGRLVDEVEDPDLASGAIALAVGSNQEGSLSVAFDNLQIRAPGNPSVPRLRPTAPGRPTPTPSPAAGEVLFQDDFSNPRSGLGSHRSAKSERDYRNGEYVFFVHQPQLTVFADYKEMEFEDFELTVEARKVSGPDDNEMGVMFRFQDIENFYLYNISSDGYYQLRKREGGEFTDLVRWTRTGAIHQGKARNLLKVVCVGEEISLYVNDTLLSVVRDGTFPRGRIALSAGTLEQGEVQVAFDNLVVRRPGVGRPEGPPREEGEIIFRDDFSDPRSGLGEYRDRNSERGYQNGEYVIKVREKDITIYADYEKRVFDDFDLTVTVRQISGPLDNYFGLLFRMTDVNNWYAFNISGDGYFQIRKRTAGDFRNVVRWTRTRFVNQGNATNHLRLVCQGDEISVYVNGHHLATVQDNDHRRGRIALAAGSNEAGDLRVAFDNLVVRRIGGGRPQPREEEEESPYLIEVELEDDFSDPSSGLGQFADANSIRGYQEGVYVIGTSKGDTAIYADYEQHTFDDFLLQVATLHVSGPVDNYYGVIFRMRDVNNFYVFNISSDGYFQVRKRKNKEFTDLVRWTKSDLIKQGVGGVNQLQVLCVGSTIAVFINGEKVAEVEDEDFRRGRIALTAGTNEGGEMMLVAFDNLTVARVRPRR